MPLAVPEYLGAMSIGTDQIGPMVSSMQKKVSARQARQDRDVLDEEQRQQEHQRAEEAADDDVAARLGEVAGRLQDAVADDAADGVAEHAARGDDRRGPRRARQAQMMTLLEELRDPAQEQPEGPAVAEIDDRRRHHARHQAPPRHRRALAAGRR